MTKKVYNRLWFVAEDDMRDYNKNDIVCYDHSLPAEGKRHSGICEICPRCKDSEICESCSEDLKKHSASQNKKCMKRLNQLCYEYTELESALSTICSHSLVMKELKMDGKTIWVRDMNKRNQK